MSPVIFFMREQPTIHTQVRNKVYVTESALVSFLVVVCKTPHIEDVAIFYTSNNFKRKFTLPGNVSSVQKCSDDAL